jgi:hypothetical protein
MAGTWCLSNVERRTRSILQVRNKIYARRNAKRGTKRGVTKSTYRRGTDTLRAQPRRSGRFRWIQFAGFEGAFIHTLACLSAGRTSVLIPIVAEAKLKPLIGKTQPYSKLIAHRSIWVEPSLLAEIQGPAPVLQGVARGFVMEVTPPNHPRFRRLRRPSSGHEPRRTRLTMHCTIMP